MNNQFNIRTPLWGVAEKYSWKEGEWGLGLLKSRVDLLARKNGIANITYWKNPREYYLEAKKIQKYPCKRIKDYDLFVYVIPISALRVKPKITDKQLCKMGAL